MEIGFQMVKLDFFLLPYTIAFPGGLQCDSPLVFCPQWVLFQTTTIMGDHSVSRAY